MNVEAPERVHHVPCAARVQGTLLAAVGSQLNARTSVRRAVPTMFEFVIAATL